MTKFIGCIIYSYSQFSSMFGFQCLFSLKMSFIEKKNCPQHLFWNSLNLSCFKKKTIFQISGKIKFRKLIFQNTQPFLVWQKNIWISNLYFQQILLPPNLVLICFKSLFPASKIFSFLLQLQSKWAIKFYCLSNFRGSAKVQDWLKAINIFSPLFQLATNFYLWN